MKPAFRFLLILFIFTLLLNACGPSPEELAATSAVETIAAASPTPLPTDTPTPTGTSTETPTPTDLPSPTITPTATRTRRPTNTPTKTPTPGPYSYFDDFTYGISDWPDCEECSWEDGRLVMGPYDPSRWFHNNVCVACGENTYYRMAVDATFIDGQVDRFYGITFGTNNTTLYFMGVSPWGFYLISRYYYEDRYWADIAFVQSGSVVGSYGTNHIEVYVQPSSNPNFADYMVYLNGDLINAIYTRPAVDTWVGLAVDFHAQVVAYDNFEYIVIEP